MDSISPPLLRQALVLHCWVSQVVVAMMLMLMTMTMMTSGQALTRYGRPVSGDFRSSPSAVRIRPPPMTSDPISPDCYNFTIGSWRLQEFYSPNYPGEYLNNTDCVLYLEAPSGFRIKLDFRDEFTLEKSDGCKFDFLEVRDGPFAYSPVIGRFCGAIFPPFIQSSNRFLWLRFKTDDLLQYGGFRAVYSYHKDHTQNDGTSLSKVASTVCRIPLKLEPSHPDGLLTSQEVPFGDVTDPDYPRNRPVDCTWEIFTDQGHSINLHTIKMSRSKSARCEMSHVSVYQGTTLESDRRARLCGNDAPDVMSLTSQNNRVFVRLYGHSLQAKPELEMVYSLVNTDDSCSKSGGGGGGGSISCGGQFCIRASMRCNGIPNCPDGRDERGCPGADVAVIPVVDQGRDRDGDKPAGPHTPAHPPVGEGFNPKDAGGGGGGRGGGGGGDTEETKIPLHMLILGAVGGVLLTCLLLGLCIMCRSRRRRHSRRQAQQASEAKAKDQARQHLQHQQQQQQQQHKDLQQAASTTPVTHPHHYQRHPGGDGRPQGQGHPQGRYLTFAHVTPLPKDSPNRHSFNTGSHHPPPKPDGSEPLAHHGDVMTDSGQFRRFLPLDVGTEHLDDGCVYTPQGVIIGMTHLPSSSSSSSTPSSHTTTTTTTPHEGGGYGSKYPSQWQKGGGMGEEHSMLYHPPPYTSSLPRPSPFLEMSTAYPGEHHGKYPKSLQSLKIREEDAIRETPAC